MLFKTPNKFLFLGSQNMLCFVYKFKIDKDRYLKSDFYPLEFAEFDPST